MSVTVESHNGTFCGKVDGVDLTAPPSQELVQQIKGFLAEYPVLYFGKQALTDEQQMAFASNFGVLMVNQYPELGGKEDGSKRLIDIATIDEETGEAFAPDSIRARMGAANFFWHADGSHQLVATRYTILSARILPTTPPDTEYADMRIAWEALPETEKAKLEGLVVEHSVFYARAKTGFGKEDFSERSRQLQPPVERPLVYTNPISGRKCLYLSASASQIVGKPLDEGRKILEDLYEYATQPQFRYNHKWQPDDVVMWDNFSVMHRATEYKGQEPRVLRWSGIQDLAA